MWNQIALPSLDILRNGMNFLLADGTKVTGCVSGTVLRTTFKHIKTQIVVLRCPNARSYSLIMMRLYFGLRFFFNW